ncbi:hypothetical protein EDI_165860 [Entamoeba dispar SAW760]|uniref:CXXC-rich protein n=1 Tax=Entamoeba dispar (strain ATCC PRA-260 / SAW760) TaxID=370354 RepID=B0EJK2_ENTDS|nr:uncharacterized protein EDI_165860 [Entamoeba dispar SAW760]EDR25324.1 hypothetical protein EDI_165860 [Entamoeba dispar SAW760]|eukprot:EDR25324.1 hypothetical protein EDI_165860 [Entamoeba dispar SAW760]
MHYILFLNFIIFISATPLCKEGYYFLNGTCVECDKYCLDGKCIDGIGCQECQPKYYFNETNRCNPCVLNCEKCTGDTLETCTKCKDGYYKSNISQICLLPYGCIDYEDFIGCKSCKEHYQLNNSMCIYKCDGCSDGYCTTIGCEKCSNWFKKSDNFGDCTKLAVGKIVFVIIIILIIILVLVGIISGILFFIKRQKRHQQYEDAYHNVN